MDNLEQVFDLVLSWFLQTTPHHKNGTTIVIGLRQHSKSPLKNLKHFCMEYWGKHFFKHKKCYGQKAGLSMNFIYPEAFIFVR
jgi:hypothetical protein